MNLTKEQLDAINYDGNLVITACQEVVKQQYSSIRLLPVCPIPRIIRELLRYHIRISPVRS